MNQHNLDQLIATLREKTRRSFYASWVGPMAAEVILCESSAKPKETKEITGPLSVHDVCRYIEGFLAGFNLGFTAQWICEECGAICEWSHIDAEDGGTPICNECSVDMVLHRFGQQEAS